VPLIVVAEETFPMNSAFVPLTVTLSTTSSDLMLPVTAH
jgi:hypothetical protein